MSVLIRMEMPSNCAECPLNHDAECAVKSRMVIDDCYVRRASWCPLAPVPPHGRLIDADMMEKECCHGCKNEFHKYENCIDCVLAHAPTVIPAELSKEKT